MKENNLIIHSHHGHNVRRLRDLLGIKQDVIAASINMSQQNFSKLEQKEIIDPETLERIATVLNIPVEVIKNFNEEGAINIISSTLHDNSGSVMYNPTFNAIDKIVELYEKLLAEKDKTIFLLEEMLKRGN
ncbi:MAG: helix-turn-helix transcriptional regulator [Tannerella sp.]|jgi:transcriptional regulator with XRE-family HTH domain|nr:helix-turn-helix transcriptional regulator [Tannerella sp.]